MRKLYICCMIFLLLNLANFPAKAEEMRTRTMLRENYLAIVHKNDGEVYVGAPDSKGREEILKVHARGKRLDDSVNLKTIARATAGFTGADLSNLLNEAAIMAARQNRPVINMNDLNEAMMKIIAGPEKRSRVRLERDRKLTAFHFAAGIPGDCFVQFLRN